jgi:hypothetical protein
MLTCPNNACGKIFNEPLTTLNLQRSSKEHYTACPYCLTEITIETENINPPEKTTTNTAFVEEVPRQNKDKLSNCTHYFGYMSIEENKKQMPEECMLCSEIIECMVKK